MTSPYDIQIIERLARIEEKQDSLLSSVHHANTRADDHETRIRVLESSGARLLGMGTILAAITGILGSRVFEAIV